MATRAYCDNNVVAHFKVYRLNVGALIVSFNCGIARTRPRNRDLAVHILKRILYFVDLN